jgi:hypothetical protein
MARTTIPAELVAVNAIQGTLIADNAITAVHIATNAISGTLIADNAITSTHIAENNVTATQIAMNTITVTQVADNAITTPKISADAVTGAKIANDSIDSEHLVDGSIDTAHIGDVQVTAAKLGDNAVTLAKMASLARGSIIVGDAAGDPAALAIGSNTYVLSSDGTDIAWAANDGITTINNNADNRVITGSGTANTLNGESGLTFDGLHLGMTSNHANHPSDVNVLQLGGNAVIQGKTATGAGKSFRVMQNVYDDVSAGLSYISTDEASHYTQVNGTHSFNVAASGTADAAITFVEAMKIDSAGNVGIGTGDPQAKLHVTSSVLIEGGSTDSRTLGFTNASGSTGWSIGNGIIDSTHNFRIYDNTAGAARVTVDGSGNVGIGTSSPSQKLHVYESATGSQAYVTVQNNRSRNAAVLTQTTNGGFYTGTSIGTDTLCWQVYDASAGERLRIDSSGRITTTAQPYTEVYNSASQSVGAVTWTSWSFNTTLAYDNTSMRTATGVITFPVAGVYMVTGLLSLQTVQATNAAQFRALFSSGKEVYLGINELVSGNDYGYDIPIIFMVKVAANVTMNIQGFSGSGNFTIRGGTNSSHMEVRLMG